VPEKHTNILSYFNCVDYHNKKNVENVGNMEKNVVNVEKNVVKT
jgi:hypothetical protein